jgi:hypothetical protein
VTEGFREFRIKSVKGPFEPWYCGLVEPDSEKVIEKWWECPHCATEMNTRKAMMKHCAGVVGQFPASCPEVKANGKCYSGCQHQ